MKLEKVKKNVKKEPSPKKPQKETINENLNKRKKALNRSMGNNNFYKELGISKFYFEIVIFLDISQHDSYSLIKENGLKKSSVLTLNESFRYNSNYNSNKGNDLNISNEISNEMMAALVILKNNLPEEYNEDFFKAIMKDITLLIEIMRQITLEATTFSDQLKENVQ